MSAKKYRLDVVDTEWEDGYDWNIVSCTECGERVQQRNIEDDGEWFQDNYRENVCPACDQAMTIKSEADKITIPSISSNTSPPADD